MKTSHSLRFKLITIFIASIFIPILIITCVIPSYYNNQLSKETTLLIDNTLTSMAENVSTYLNELDKLTINPYYYEGVLLALKLKAHGHYDTADAYTKLEADRALNSAISNYLSYTRKDILNTVIINGDNCLFYSTRDKDVEIIKDYNFSKKSWYKSAIEANGKAVFIGSHKQDYFSNSHLPEVFSIARLIKDPNTQEPLAVIMADANTEIFNRMFSKLKFNVPSTIMLLDKENRVLYSTKPISSDVLNKIDENNNIIDTDDGSYMAITKEIKPSEWKIVVLLSYSKMRSKTKWMYIVSIIFALGGLFVTFLIFDILSENLVSPI